MHVIISTIIKIARQEVIEAYPYVCMPYACDRGLYNMYVHVHLTGSLQVFMSANIWWMKGQG